MTTTILYPAGVGDRTEWIYVFPLADDHWFALTPGEAGLLRAQDPGGGPANASGDADLYTFDTFTMPAGDQAIAYVKVNIAVNWEDDSPGTITVAPLFKQDGTETLGDDQSTGSTTGETVLVWTYTSDPTQAGTVAWTDARINSGQYGPELRMGGADERVAVVGVWLEVFSYKPTLYLFGSSESDGHTNVFGRSASGDWIYLPAANPDTLWFESLSCDYSSMLPNGFSVDNNLYGYVPAYYDTSLDLVRFNKSTRQLEAGPTHSFTPDVFDRFYGWWVRDIGNTAPAVFWTFPTNSPPHGYYWDGNIADAYTSPRASTDDQWLWRTDTVSDFTTMPKDLMRYSSHARPFIQAYGLYIFRLGTYYWGVSNAFLDTSGSSSTAFLALAVIRFQDPNTPPDNVFEIGTDSLRAIFSPHTPTLSENHTQDIDQLYARPPVAWGGHFWLPMQTQSHYTIDGVIGTPIAGENTTCLALLTSSGDVLAAMDFPSVLTYVYGAGVFVHQESGKVFAWVRSGTTYGYGSTTRLSLFWLSAYDLGAPSFTWTALSEQDVTSAGLPINPVADADALYFGYGFTTDQVVYRYDIAGDSWSTENIIGMMGDEYITTLAKIAALASSRRPQWAAVIG